LPSPEPGHPVAAKKPTCEIRLSCRLPEYLGLLPRGYSAPGWQGAKAKADRQPPPAPAPRHSPPPFRAPARPPVNRQGMTPLKPLPERERAESAVTQPPRMADFACPHCETTLEVDPTSLAASEALSCPACQGIIHLEFE